MKVAPSKSAILRKKTGIPWRFLAVIVVGVLLASVVTAGCQPATSPDEEIPSEVAAILLNTAITAIKAMDGEIAGMNSELTAVRTKLAKMEQVAKPALDWVEFIKGKAQQEQWNGRTLEVTSDLAKFKNDQYQVVKLQFIVEMLTAGMRYTGVIHIDELATGKVTPYEELRSSLQRQVDEMVYKREAKAKARNLARSTALDLGDQYQQWKATQISSVTYKVTGHGLGVAQGPTMGVWTYSTDSGKLIPTDEAAIALERVLLGK